jgi:peptide-methionine (S)-S-oxide reductase
MKEPEPTGASPATHRGYHLDERPTNRRQDVETAIFAAGCFWQVEADFRNLEGVIETAAGYTGGKTEEPTYEEVCTDRTGHAEAVQVTYDPSQVTYEELLDVFWRSHDPTQLNRQGPDIGSQYRSAIFFASPEQEKSAIASRDAAQERFERPIVTEITEAPSFYPAEDYHQRYLEKRGQASCSVTVRN